MAKITKEDLEKKKEAAAEDNKEKVNIFINVKKAKVTVIVANDATGYDRAAYEDSVKKKNKGMISSIYSSTAKTAGKPKTIDQLSKNKKGAKKKP